MQGIISTELPQYLEQIEFDRNIDVLLAERQFYDAGAFIGAGNHPITHLFLRFLERASEQKGLPLAAWGPYFGQDLSVHFTQIFSNIMCDHACDLTLTARKWRQEKDHHSRIHYQSYRPSTMVTLGVLEQRVEHFDSGHEITPIVDAGLDRAGFELRPTTNLEALAA